MPNLPTLCNYRKTRLLIKQPQLLSAYLFDFLLLLQKLILGFYNQWADLSNFGPEQLETIRTAGYYAIDATNQTNLKIVSINGNYG